MESDEEYLTPPVRDETLQEILEGESWVPVIALFFKPSFHSFSQSCSMFTPTVILIFLRFTLLPLCFGSLMTSYDLFMTIPFIVIFHLFFVHTLSFKERELCFIL